MILYSCPTCGTHLEAENHCAGQKHACPQCGQDTEVPFQIILSPDSAASTLSPPSRLAPPEPPPAYAPDDVDEGHVSGSRLSETGRMGLLAVLTVLGGVGIVLLIVLAQFQGQKPSVPAKRVARLPEEGQQGNGEPPRETVRELADAEPAGEKTIPRRRAGEKVEEAKESAIIKPLPPAEAPRPSNDQPTETKKAVTADPAPAKTAPSRQSSDKAKSDKPSGDRKKSLQDLPPVPFVIPKETRPEVKAILSENTRKLRSKLVSDRVQAAEVLGELKEQGKPGRGPLCQAMLDRSESVRVAAADALKNIDPKMQYLAVALLTEENRGKRTALYGKIQKLEDEGEPLSPLITHAARQSAAKEDTTLLSQELTVLSHIAKKDSAAYRLIASALGHGSESLRRSAIEALARMKHGGLAVRPLIALLNTDTVENRVATIHTLVAVADKTTEETIAAAIARQRYHKEEKVRRAVEEALNKLQNKKAS